MSNQWKNEILTEILGKLEGEEVPCPMGEWPENVVRWTFPGDSFCARYFKLPNAQMFGAFVANYVLKTGDAVIQFSPNGFGDEDLPVITRL